MHQHVPPKGTIPAALAGGRSALPQSIGRETTHRTQAPCIEVLIEGVRIVAGQGIGIAQVTAELQRPGLIVVDREELLGTGLNLVVLRIAARHTGFQRETLIVTRRRHDTAVQVIAGPAGGQLQALGIVTFVFYVTANFRGRIEVGLDGGVFDARPEVEPRQLTDGVTEVDARAVGVGGERGNIGVGVVRLAIENVIAP